ncbi:MAG: hydantoinase/oxoprolinase family protein [Ilumatobacteraceae bacterium]
MSWRCAIAVDVGGTFTDIALARTDGRRHTGKVPSVPADPSAGVFSAVNAVADELGIDARDLLGRCDRFVHGSTVATNAVLTGNLARVGLITTAGFRDSLEIRRGIRDDQWDHRAPWPDVVVPRHRRLGVPGRIGADGVEIESLDDDAVERAIDVLRSEQVDAIAICLLHSYANQRHEQRVATLTRKTWPGALTTLSSDLTPHLGEYARTSTAVVNAGLVPMVGGYLARLADGLTTRGLAGPLLMLQSNGGTVPLDALAARPVDLVLSGPAAVGGATRRLAAISDAIVTMEIGGTSCDVAVSAQGAVPVVDGLVVGGYHLDVPAVDVHTVGAGGGTIASVDSAGILCVGPAGAGADPGPACYGRGGERPTATDVHLLLGRLRPGPYAGGSVSLDADLAERAVRDHLAVPLGVDVEDAAIGVLTILEQHLRHAVETITVQRGRDPAQMTLVAAGGAGGLHGSSVARRIGCRRLIVPAEAGVFCALGMLDCDLRRDVSRSVVGRLDDLGPERVRDLVRTEHGRALELVANEWPAGIDATPSCWVDLRYPGQLWSVRVSVDDVTVRDFATLRADFEQEYGRLYGHVQPQGALELTGVGVAMLGTLEPSAPVVLPVRPPARPIEHRRCWVDDATGWNDVPVYAGEQLGAGAELDGPFIIEAATTTVLGLTGDHLVVNEAGDLDVTVT